MMSDKKKEAPIPTSILALDPGREKVCLALLKAEGKVLKRQIVESSELLELVQEILCRYKPAYIVVGDGTGCCHLAGELRTLVKETGKIDPSRIKIVDEEDSSREAAKLYFNEEAGPGRSFLSHFLSWRPREPVDDFAAVVLGRRFLEDNKEAKKELKKPRGIENRENDEKA